MFTIRGRRFDIEGDDVINAVKNVEPELLTGKRKYYVELNGKRYPIKQVISLVTGLPRIAFTAVDATTTPPFLIKISTGKAWQVKTNSYGEVLTTNYSGLSNSIHGHIM